MIGLRPLALAALAGLLVACGARLTPPDLPPARVELDRLARAEVAGTLQPAERRRLAILLDRHDNAPARADLIDGELDLPRARQAAAWRAWSRQRPGWVGLVARAVVADPADAGAAALAVLLRRASPADVKPQLAGLKVARATLRPITRCLVDGLWTPNVPSPCAALPDLQTAHAELAAADPDADPEADRLLWTLAHWGPAADAQAAAAAVDRWTRRWPRHGSGWAMAGATAAADAGATASERLAWSGAAWIRAVTLDPAAFRAHVALADLEARVGLSAAADRHRLNARRAVGDDRRLPSGWARAPVPRGSSSALPPRPTANAIRQATERRGQRIPTVLLDRTVVRLAAGRLPMAETQRLASAPFAEASGCIERRHGPDASLYEQRCRRPIIPVDDVVEIGFATARAAARGEIVVRAANGTDPTIESHGGAPGARVSQGPAETVYTFALDDVEPARDGPRRPRVRVKVARLGRAAPVPPAGMVDRLAARSGDGAAGHPPIVPGDTARTVARMRSAGLIAERAWVLVDGRPVALWARWQTEGWRWFDAQGATYAGDGPIIAASHPSWLDRTPSTIPRAAAGDLPSSSTADPPDTAGTEANQSGRR